MNWGILSRKIAKAGFPALGGALAGPAGAVVGASLAARLGVEATPDSVAKAVAIDPDLTIALRRIEAEMAAGEQRHVERLVGGRAEAAAEAAEFQEANVREARLTPDLNRTRGWFTIVMLAALLLSLAALIAVEVAWDIPDMVLGLAVGVVGGLLTLLQQMIAYFFGTSSGSAAKERTAAAERMATIERSSPRG